MSTIASTAEPSGQSIAPSKLRRRGLLQRWRVPVVCAALAFGFWGGYRACTAWWVEREDERTPRDETTGIMLGAEPRGLGPVDSPNAALFVHGYAGCGNNFNQLPDLLAEKGWRVRVLLLPGHGTSPKDMENVSTDTLVHAVVTETEALAEKHEHVILIGHSMGSALSTITAAQVPVDGLVLGGAYFGVTHHWYYGLRPEKWTVIGSHLVRWVYKGDLFLQVNDRSAKDSIVCYTWLPTHAGLMLNDLGRRVNEASVLDNVTCPVLMLHSRGDVAASPAAAERAFNAMASEDKMLVWLPRSNHHIYWDYDHEQVEREVLEFVGRIAGQSSDLQQPVQ
ncbi:MAG: alpha/beta fold hydrolase [Candidatus Hydrogenedentes bacterium]|nr:alpha/beta fold hydrolase [Candidatus Hydrogenedentota bacterium]